MRLFGYPYNDLVICKDSPDNLAVASYILCYMRLKQALPSLYETETEY